MPVRVIPHGFDQADMKDLPAYRPAPDEPFVLLYPGRLYPEYQDPTSLFQAVKRLDQAGHIHPGSFSIHFVGTEPEYPTELARESQISDYVRFSPLVPYTTSLRLQSQASALLLFKWQDPGETGVCPAKLFEYLGVGRPVLTLGDKRDVVDDIVQECGAGATTSSADEVVAVLRTWVSTYRRSSKLPWRSHEVAVQRYTRSAAAEALADLLDRVSDGRERS
jgi:glycosyltransferase involved in cell wall biosynthesis